MMYLKPLEYNCNMLFGLHIHWFFKWKLYKWKAAAESFTHEVNETFVCFQNHGCSNWKSYNWKSEAAFLQLKHNGINYHIPLKRYIATHIQTLTLDSSVSWGNMLKSSSIINTNFKWPEVMVAAMNSVVTEFNRHPPQPRLYSVTDDELLNDITSFKEKTEYYYTEKNS